MIITVLLINQKFQWYWFCLSIKKGKKGKKKRKEPPKWRTIFKRICDNVIERGRYKPNTTNLRSVCLFCKLWVVEFNLLLKCSASRFSLETHWLSLWLWVGNQVKVVWLLLPAATTLFGLCENHCVSRLNRDALSFNWTLNYSTAQNLQNRLTDLKLVVFDINPPSLLHYHKSYWK